MQRSNAGGSTRRRSVVSSDFECQVGGVTALYSRSSGMASHPPLPELTGTKDKQCQAFALTADFQCQVIRATSEAQCQFISEMAENFHPDDNNHLSQGQKHRKSNTVCSASQCGLPSPLTQLADAQNQADVRGMATFSSLSDVCSQTELVKTISSLDAMNQTDRPTANTRSSGGNTKDTGTMTMGASGGQNVPGLGQGQSVQASSSRDFQCQASPESCDEESQADAREGP